MTTSIIPISNVINVTITDTPTGLAEANVNSLALFATESPGNVDPFRTYVTAQEVATDYGTNSIAAAMAANVFSQSPNILSGNGQLVIIPLQSAVSATQGDFTTASIVANLSNFIAVDDGDIEVTLNGVTIQLTDLDFTSATTLDDVADVFQAQLSNVIVTATTTSIVFQSKTVGDDSDVVVAQFAAGVGTDLSDITFLNTTAGTATSGADATGETIAEAIVRTESTVGYVGVITDLEMEDDVVTALASTIQSRDMILLHHFADTGSIAGIGTTISGASQTQTRAQLYTTSTESANLVKTAYAGRAFSVNFNGSNTAQTMNLKSLANVVADPGINQTLYTAAKTAGVDLYVNYEGLAGVLSTGGNSYFDQIYNRLALKFGLETNGFNYLRQTNTKVPQTEDGIEGLKSAYQAVMTRFVANGVIGVGLEWNSADTFGNPEDFRRNITETGFYIYSVPIAQQSQAERTARNAPLIQIAFKEAGAIHSSDVTVNVEA